MFFDSLYRALTRTSKQDRPGRRAKKPSRGRPRSPRLALEMLEDRLTPSITVTSSADSGPNTLRQDIMNAPNGATIDFAHSVTAITLTTGELAISKNLDIEGAGKVTVSVNDAILASRVFHISGPVHVTIAGLTIAHGQSTGTLAALGIYAGTGSGAGGGGGILNEAGANLTLKQDVFNDNEAIGAVGFTVVGGALLNLGTAAVASSEFTNNQAVGGGALDAIGGSAGAAIDNFGGPTGGATLTVTNSTFSNNTSMAAGGGYYFGIAGGIDNNGGLNGFDPTLAQASTAVITNSSFLNNLATGGPNALGNGGALSNAGVGSIMKLDGSTLTGNRSVGGGGGDGVTTGDSEGIGGGIVNLATLDIDCCTITNNQAIGGANAILSAYNPVTMVGDPLAGGAFGGGIENNASAVLNISNSTICGNVSQGGATPAGPGGDAVGGGISNSPSATMTMTNCTVSSNSATGGQGGPGVNTMLGSVPAGFGFGGGIDTSRGSSATITRSVISGNKAVGGAGGTGNDGGNGLGGGLGVGWGTLVGFSPDASQVTLINSVVSNNLALGGQAGAGGGTALGGGLAINVGCSATVDNSTIKDNVANGGQTNVNSGQANGGGGIDNAGTLILNKSKVNGNQAVTTNGSDTLGGGLLNNEGTATILNTTFDGNQALGGSSFSFFSGSTGGAIDNYEGASLAINNSSFSNNECISAADAPGNFNYATGGAIEEDAGVINNNPSTATITNSTFTDNLVTGGFGVIGNGGGIDIQSENDTTPGLVTLTLVGCSITGNGSVGGGGGDGVTTGDSSGIGGGVMSVRGNLTISSCTIANNQAVGGDGAILSAYDPVTMIGDPFAGGGYGGGISNNDSGFTPGSTNVLPAPTKIGVLVISNSTISGNIARGGNTDLGTGGNAVGGGVTNSPEATMTMTNCDVVGNKALGGTGSVPSLPGVGGGGGVECGFGFGGGVDTSNGGSSATIIDSFISCNSATGGAGTHGNVGGTGYGGGLGVGWATLVGLPTDGSSLTLIDSVVSNNLAEGGQGGAGANGGNGFGGGLYVAATCSATVTVSKIEYNQAVGGEEGKGGSHDGLGIGGGVYYDGMFSDDLLTVIAHNLASTSNNNIFP